MTFAVASDTIVGSASHSCFRELAMAEAVSQKTSALASMARAVGIEPRILDAVDDVNTRQKNVIYDKIEQHFKGNLSGRRIAIWGLAFKPPRMTFAKHQH